MARRLISNGVVLFAVAAVLTAKVWLAAVALMGGYLRYYGMSGVRKTYQLGTPLCGEI